MSQKRKERSAPILRKVSQAEPTRETHADPHRKTEVRWIKYGVFAVIVASLIGAVVGPLATLALPTLVEMWLGPKVSFNSREVILVNGRVFEVNVINDGQNLAKDVNVMLEGSFPNFKFDEAQSDHVHTTPVVATEVKVKGNKLEVKLMGPIGRKQAVAVTIDNIHFDKAYMPIFTAWAGSDRGQADRKGHSVESFPNLTLNKYLGLPEGQQDQR